MSISELEKTLDEALKAFSEEMHLQYSEGSQKPATEADIHEVARQTFYTLDLFKQAIIRFEEERE